MQTIEVTDEQHAFVQRLREEISEQVVGKYGYVRERDAIQFLIDNLDGDLELDAEFDADGVGTDVPSTAEVDESEDGAAVTFDESDSELEPESDDGDPDESVVDEADGNADDADETDESDEPEADEPTGDDSEGVDEAEKSEDEPGDGDASETDGDGAADDDDMLNEMMSLLDTHEDKWDESSSADYRYSVELPDGTTEDVQTKDDVRALLFKHYR